MKGSAYYVPNPRILALFLLAAAGLAMAPGQQGHAATDKDTLTFVEGVDFDSLDPAIARTRSAEVVTRLICNRLVTWKRDMSEIVPDLAESWTVSDDGLVYTFKLKKGIKFHDGTPFNAQAVKFNIERVRNPDTGSPYRKTFEPFKVVTAIGDYTLKIESEKPYPTFLEALADTAGQMNSPAAVEKMGKNYSSHPVGTGPYSFAEWKPSQYVKLTRNPDYFGPPGKMQTIIYRPVPEGEARVVELESGNADIVTQIPPEAVDRIKSNPDLELKLVPSSFQIFMELNTMKEPFNDVRIRRAIQYAIDRKAIVEKVLGGLAQLPDNVIPPGVQSYQPIKEYPYDPERVKKAFAEVYPNGFNGTIEIWTPNGRYLKDRLVAEAIQGYLNAIGLKTSFRAWEWSSFLTEIKYKKPKNKKKPESTPHLKMGDMWMLGTSIPTFHWRMFRRTGSQADSNNTGYNNKRVDELFELSHQTFDHEKRMAYFHEIQKILWEEDPPFLYLHNQVQVIGLKKNIENLQVYSFELPILENVTKK